LPRKLGQHFLIREAVLRKIAEAACPAPEPLVVEIGPGRGALTAHLLERALRVVAIEVDPGLAAHLRTRFPDAPLTVLERDVLAVDLAQFGPAVLVGNLPYYITSPILDRAFAALPAWSRAVFLVQREVAERLTAAPGSRDYGYWTVKTRLLAAPEFLFPVAAGAFQPPPKVESAVVRLTPPGRLAEFGIEREPFLEFLSACFRQKRKTLRNNLAARYGREVVEALPFAAKRAEQLSLDEFAELYRLVASAAVK
jgi:16S rRNA (adenine1518-N6/adenine1519-N6)-dimethyltransferase